jgi:hypothetical protein
VQQEAIRDVDYDAMPHCIFRPSTVQCDCDQ